MHLANLLGNRFAFITGPVLLNLSSFSPAHTPLFGWGHLTTVYAAGGVAEYAAGFLVRIGVYAVSHAHPASKLLSLRRLDSEPLFLTESGRSSARSGRS